MLNLETKYEKNKYILGAIIIFFLLLLTLRTSISSVILTTEAGFNTQDVAKKILILFFNVVEDFEF